jgi:hypothetical protein
MRSIFTFNIRIKNMYEINLKTSRNNVLNYKSSLELELQTFIVLEIHPYKNPII